MEYELILCIINKGFSDNVMEVVTKAGARGGTVINARGTAKEEAEKLFGLAINPEKEIVLIVINKDLKDDILKAIYTNCGLDSAGQGIAFAMPIDEAVGLNPVDLVKEEDK